MAAPKSKPRSRTRAASTSVATGSPHTLSYHRSEKLPLHRLPFVGQKPDHLSFWCVPPIGGYGGGCETGAAMAWACLRYLTTDRTDYGGVLQHIVLDMFDAYQHATTDEQRQTVRGQIVGFCSEVCWTIRRFMPPLGSDGAPEKEQILARANAGLAGYGGF